MKSEGDVNASLKAKATDPKAKVTDPKAKATDPKAKATDPKAKAKTFGVEALRGQGLASRTTSLLINISII